MLNPEDVITRRDGEPDEVYNALLMLAAMPPEKRILAELARLCNVTRPTPGRWRDKWDWERRLAAYDAALSDPVTGPLTRAVAAADRPADPEERDELVRQIRAYRAQVLQTADAIQVVAMRALGRVRERLDGLTDAEIGKMSMRDLAALANMALGAVKQAQASKGDIYGLTEFVAYLENGGRDANKTQVSHRSDDAEAE